MHLTTYDLCFKCLGHENSDSQDLCIKHMEQAMNAAIADGDAELAKLFWEAMYRC